MGSSTMTATITRIGHSAIHAAGLLGNDLGISTQPQRANEKPENFGPEET